MQQSPSFKILPLAGQVKTWLARICSLKLKKSVNLRLSNFAIYTAEVLEIQADDPKLHFLFVPGNPGVITFYKDFVESLYVHLGGNASITAVGNAAQTKENFDRGRFFSLDEQIDHKMDFIRQELHNTEAPIVLVGHSIGAYIALEMLKRSSEKCMRCRSSIASAALSFAIASLGILPSTALRFFVSKSLGRSWSATAVEATCTHLSQLTETPDWAFMRKNHSKIAYLFGVDDHWGPLEMYEEISKQVPEVPLAIERHGYTHNFCCSEAGSAWVASHVAGLIKNKISSLCK